MPSTTLSSRLPVLHPRQSLQRLRTALSPLLQQEQPASSDSSASPLSASTPFSVSSSSLSLSGAVKPRRISIRRQKSTIELEQAEERTLVGDELIMSLVEPRPAMGPACGTIAEILEGWA